MRLTKTIKRQVIYGDKGEPYLIRWALNTRFGGVKLHHILRSDEDRDCHDHPWSFLSIILRGGYFEHTPHPNFERSTQRRWYGPGSILWRPAPSIHRLELPEPTRSPLNVPEDNTAWSLVFTGPKKREWGFHTVCGFIPWFRYQRAKEDGC
jgi:hypothetical protein